MVGNWRPTQIKYNAEARKKLAGKGRRFWAWEIVIRFYEVVIALDGYAEMLGLGAPKSHAARRAIVEKWLRHLVDAYDGLYGLGLTARYNRGYSMSEAEALTAAHCDEILMKGILGR